MHFAGSPLAGIFPGPRAVDRFPVDLEPVAHLRKPFFHDDGDHSVGPRTDVEQEVAAAADRVDQDKHQFPASVINVEIFGAVVAVTYAHATAFFPWMVDAAHSCCVFRGPVAAMFVAGVAAPTIIHHHFVLNGGLVEQPCQQFRAVPIGRSHLPLTIAEDYCRFVVRDQVLELREHVLAHVTRLVVKPERVIPLVKRIVEAHAQAFAPHRVGEIAKYIAFGTDFDRVPRTIPRS